MAGTTGNVKAQQEGIVVSGLSFAYGRTPVLRDVTFRLRPCAVGLLGPNGSGKTTLLRALLGHLPLPPGRVTVLGHDMARRGREARRRLGWMPERGGILPHFSGVGMVAYLGELAGMAPTDALQRAHEVLNFVGLDDERYRPAETYSQGMRQRLKLAQALVHDPAWLLLDEPTSGLDPRGRVVLLRLVRELAAEHGLGIILSTHLLADVRSVCDEILVLREGRLLAHQPVRSLADDGPRTLVVEGFGDEAAFLQRLAAAGATVRPRRRGWEVTLEGADPAATVLAAAAGADFALRRLVPRTASLEDRFFALVGEEVAGEVS